MNIGFELTRTEIAFNSVSRYLSYEFTECMGEMFNSKGP